MIKDHYITDEIHKTPFYSHTRLHESFSRIYLEFDQGLYINLKSTASCPLTCSVESDHPGWYDDSGQDFHSVHSKGTSVCPV